MMGIVSSSAITKFLKDLEDEITISDNLSEFKSSTIFENKSFVLSIRYYEKEDTSLVIIENFNNRNSNCRTVINE